MVKHVMCVFDRVAQLFHDPFCVVTRGIAIRDLSTEVNKHDNNPLAAHPFDYELWELAEFDPDEGELVPKREHVCSLSSLVVAKE